MEGIMMRNQDRYSVGIRKPDGGISVEVFHFKPYSERFLLARIPFVRGSFAFVESLVIGIKTLMYSASFLEDDKEEEIREPSYVEKWLIKRFGEKLDGFLVTLSMVIAFVVALVIFMWFPMLVAMGLENLTGSVAWTALFEGVFRVALFIIYIKLISSMREIRRTFMYHGAEHKCINCIEHGLELNIHNSRVSSREHKRCGTSFIFIVMIIAILVFMLIRVDNIVLRLALRIILMPVIAGLSYEFLRLAGRSDNHFINLLSRPGLWMQSLTTREPDNYQLEVAIAAVNAVFDWKEYEKKEFPNGPDDLGTVLLEKSEDGARKKPTDKSCFARTLKISGSIDRACCARGL